MAVSQDPTASQRVRRIPQEPSCAIECQDEGVVFPFVLDAFQAPQQGKEFPHVVSERRVIEECKFTRGVVARKPVDDGPRLMARWRCQVVLHSQGEPQQEPMVSSATREILA